MNTQKNEPESENEQYANSYSQQDINEAIGKVDCLEVLMKLNGIVAQCSNTMKMPGFSDFFYKKTDKIRQYAEKLSDELSEKIGI